MKDEAEERGITLKFSDAQGKQENEIKAVRGFIAQGVDAIVLAPVVETGGNRYCAKPSARRFPWCSPTAVSKFRMIRFMPH